VFAGKGLSRPKRLKARRACIGPNHRSRAQTRDSCPGSTTPVKAAVTSS
jgi:hypothetical protein